MGDKGGGKMPVVDYHLSVHFGVCHGPVDAITRVIIKEKEAWRGRATEMGQYGIFNMNLFGGRKKEGGVGGSFDFLPGHPDQKLDLRLTSRFRRTPDNMPAYRGITTLFFTGGGYGDGGDGTEAGNGRPKAVAWTNKQLAASTSIETTGGGFGFYWGSNNPYLPATWVTVERQPVVSLESFNARIDNLVPVAWVDNPDNDPEPPEDDDEEPEVPDAFEEDPLNGYFIGALPPQSEFVRTKFGYRATPDAIDDDPAYARDDKYVYRNYGPDANPAHIIFEALTNTEWGMGAPVTAFDVPAFNALAATLKAEKFGLSLMWTQQTDIESFVTEILDHIQALYYLDPRSGLYSIRAIRDDFDPETVPELNPDNATINTFSRKAWGETINEIVLTWTNPENEQDSTVTLQDLANIALQGGVISDSRNYYGVRNQALAKRLATRDLRTASAPSASFEATLDRSFWFIKPGDVVKVTFPEEGIEGAFFRAMDVDYGKIGNSKIEVKFVEDVFSLPTAGYSVGAPGTLWEPTDALAEPLSSVNILTANYTLMARAGLTSGKAYPDAQVVILAGTKGRDTTDFSIVSSKPLSGGGEELGEIGDRLVQTTAELAFDLPKEFVSIVETVAAMTRGVLPTPGGLLFVGEGDQGEICLITEIDDEIGLTLHRGQLDTVPRAWPAGTPVWFVSDTAIFDSTTRLADVPVEYRLLPMTSVSKLEPDEVDPIEYTPNERAWAPYRPANCKIDGQPFERKYTTRPTGTVNVTWANRNRTTEDVLFRKWTDESVTPEAGQTTTIRVLHEDGTQEAEHVGLTGTTFALPLNDLTGGPMRVQFFAEREGIESVQAFEVILNIPYQAGYGFGYGAKYGE